jgi:hypothetical protein
MDNKVVSLGDKERDRITQYGHDIGKLLQSTITIIRNFVDYLSKQPFRYSMFGEISAAFAQVQINS